MAHRVPHFYHCEAFYNAPSPPKPPPVNTRYWSFIFATACITNHDEKMAKLYRFYITDDAIKKYAKLF